jgi:hypothetical protein
MLALANAALAAVSKVQDLNSSTGDSPSQEIEDASAQAALLMDCCANMTHDLAVAERVATEVREMKEAFFEERRWSNFQYRAFSDWSCCKHWQACDDNVASPQARNVVKTKFGGLVSVFQGRVSVCPLLQVVDLVGPLRGSHFYECLMYGRNGFCKFAKSYSRFVRTSSRSEQKGVLMNVD